MAINVVRLATDSNSGAVDILRTNKFRVDFINMPAGVGGPLASQDGFLFAEEVAFPGRAFSTVERRTHGPVMEVPYERTFSGDLEITFKLLQGNNVRASLEVWMDLIIGGGLRDTSTGTLLRSREDYTCDVLIDVYNGSDNMLGTGPMAMNIFEVYPKRIDPIQLSDRSDNEYVSQRVAFSFRDYEFLNDGNVV